MLHSLPVIASNRQSSPVIEEDEGYIAVTLGNKSGVIGRAFGVPLLLT